MNILFILISALLCFKAYPSNLSVLKNIFPYSYIIFAYIFIFSFYYAYRYASLCKLKQFYYVLLPLNIGMLLPFTEKSILGEIHVFCMYSSLILSIIILIKYFNKKLLNSNTFTLKLIKYLSYFSSYLMILFFFEGKISSFFEFSCAVFIVFFEHQIKKDNKIKRLPAQSNS